MYVLARAHVQYFVGGNSQGKGKTTNVGSLAFVLAVTIWFSFMTVVTLLG